LARLRSPHRDTLTLNDGVSIDLACRLIHNQAFPENLNGIDLTPAVLGLGIGKLLPFHSG
jgi:UDP-N-acetyl-D-mannosaminuronic acid transferase (WecB/TagA/CpsF family)